MIDHLIEVEKKYEQISMELQRPETVGNNNLYRQLMKEYSSLGEIVTAFRKYQKLKSDLKLSQEMLEKETDPELKAMAQEESDALEKELPELEQQLKIMLLPKDPNDDKNIVLEIRAGAGGDEASLFCSELFEAYAYYARDQGWKVEVLSTSAGNVGGYKEVIATVSGDRVYSKLKYESGVQRVQRVPKTETQGRVHTSTITVAVLPEAEEVDVKIDPNDLQIDVYRSGGAGGQSVNTTDSAVRITHLPTGIVVTCQDERSQLKNKGKAMKILLSRMLDRELQTAQKEASDARLSQMGTGDRSERIRTYNFPQSRITDHRIGLTTHNIDAFMGGKCEIMIDPLITHYQTEALKGSIHKP
ncbi:MAG: peptide chain release factor 1 [Bdellovibrionales bacterium]|nr:peptide chain release factor 1 [Bdellovibrionales bacterium]